MVFEALSEKFEHIKQVVKHKWDTTDMSHEWFMYTGSCIVAGFLCGFLIKHFGRILFLLVLGALVSLCLLHYFDLVVVNSSKIYTIFGLPAHPTLHSVAHHVCTWCHYHTARCVAAVIGFILALIIT